MKQNKILIYVLAALAVLAMLGLVAFTAAKVLQFRGDTQVVEEQQTAAAESTRIQPNLDTQGSFEVNGVRYTPRKRVETYLIMGIDRTEIQLEKGMNAQADMLLLLVLDPETQTFQILQLNRDTITQVTVLSSDDQITDSIFTPLCLAQGFGSTEAVSCENTIRAIRYLLSDVEIDGYLCLNLNSVQEINASVGGVTVKIEDDMTALDPSFKKGATVTLTDKNVEYFVRARMSLGEEDNLGRMRRQRAFLNSWIEKAQKKAQQNAGFMLSFLEDLKKFSVSDLSDKTISGIASTMEKYENLGIVTIDGEYRMGTIYNEFYVDTESVQEVLVKLFYTAQPIE